MLETIILIMPVSFKIHLLIRSIPGVYFGGKVKERRWSSGISLNSDMKFEVTRDVTTHLPNELALKMDGA
jgi:hypothetical protein